VGSRAVQQAAEAQEPEPGEIVTAFIGDLSATATAAGEIRPWRQTTLSATSPGQVQAVNVRPGSTVEAGDLLVQLDTTNLALNVATAEQNLRLQEANLAALQEPANAMDIAAAAAAVASAQTNLDDLLAGPSAEEMAAYEASLRQSEASLASASASLASAQDTIKQSQIEAARAALEAARLQQESAQEINEDFANAQTHQALLQANQAVADAQAQLDALLAGPDTGAAQSNVAAAAARLDSAAANYNLQTGAANAAQVASAQAQLAQAQATLTGLQEGATAAQIAIATAEVAQARLNLEDAQQALTEASITAPFDGVVTAVHVSAGEFASGLVVEMADTAQFEVVLEVDELDIGRLHPGQSADLTLEAWPEESIAGEITAIAPIANAQAGSSLVIYEVHLTLGETDLPIRMGMTANANLITEAVENVLLVPNQAIHADRSSGTYTVTRVVGEENEEIPVTIGLRDSQYTQITGGLQEGDQLLISNGAPVGDVFGNP
jgi:HlyD family secretion protein